MLISSKTHTQFPFGNAVRSALPATELETFVAGKDVMEWGFETHQPIPAHHPFSMRVSQYAGETELPSPAALREVLGTSSTPGDFSDLVGADINELVSRVPKSAKEGTWRAGRIKSGLRYLWKDEEGRQCELRIHGPDNRAPKKSASRNGWIYRVEQGEDIYLYPDGETTCSDRRSAATHIPVAGNPKTESWTNWVNQKWKRNFKALEAKSRTNILEGSAAGNSSHEGLTDIQGPLAVFDSSIDGCLDDHRPVAESINDIGFPSGEMNSTFTLSERPEELLEQIREELSQDRSEQVTFKRAGGIMNETYRDSLTVEEAAKSLKSGEKILIQERKAYPSGAEVVSKTKIDDEKELLEFAAFRLKGQIATERQKKAYQLRSLVKPGVDFRIAKKRFLFGYQPTGTKISDFEAASSLRDGKTVSVTTRSFLEGDKTAFLSPALSLQEALTQVKSELYPKP